MNNWGKLGKFWNEWYMLEIKLLKKLHFKCGEECFQVDLKKIKTRWQDAIKISKKVVFQKKIELI